MGRPFQKKWHLIIVAIAFLLCLITVYFGGSIYSAANNQFITHLNEMDNIGYYSVKDIPKLSQTAAFITLPFLVAMIVLNLLVRFRSKNSSRKRIAIAAILAMSFVLLVDIGTIVNPVFFDFGGWGYFWISLSILIIAGNLYAYFLKEED